MSSKNKPKGSEKNFANRAREEETVVDDLQDSDYRKVESGTYIPFTFGEEGDCPWNCTGNNIIIRANRLTTVTSGGIHIPESAMQEQVEEVMGRPCLVLKVGDKVSTGVKEGMMILINPNYAGLIVPLHDLGNNYAYWAVVPEAAVAAYIEGEDAAKVYESLKKSYAKAEERAASALARESLILPDSKIVLVN